jgi:tetratricopeptide (TPR) repeat protein
MAKSSSSINFLLKEAHKSIDAKDYASALKYCQEVLEFDPKNYNALIFTGVSYANLNPPQIEKSEDAYKNAIAIDDKKPLAWQVSFNLSAVSLPLSPISLLHKHIRREEN